MSDEELKAAMMDIVDELVATAGWARREGLDLAIKVEGVVKYRNFPSTRRTLNRTIAAVNEGAAQ